MTQGHVLLTRQAVLLPITVFDKSGHSVWSGMATELIQAGYGMTVHLNITGNRSDSLKERDGHA